jgi:mannonate dehydratase
MTKGNLYHTVEQYSVRKGLAYVHFRNVSGKAPHYHETFIDNGDVDMLFIIAILRMNRVEGVLIPDHGQQMTCADSRHAGVPHALSLMRAAIMVVVCGFSKPI